MRQRFASIPDIKSIIPVLLPVALWAMLFLGLGAGRPHLIWDSNGLDSFINGIRSVLPLVAAGSAAVFMVYRILQGSMPTGRIFGPLVLASFYGVIGLVAAFNSPDGSEALWWAGLYLSVPVFLWGIVWTADPLDQLRPLVNATWLAVILATGVLVLVAIFKLDLVDRILDPNLLLKCRAADWVDLTSGRIRGTGVGRYAAITALIAISGMWMPKWRRVWSVVLVISLVFLLYTAARGSFVGFGAGAALILIIYMASSGRKALATGLVVVAVALPVLWGTGILYEFLENCFFRSDVTSPVTSPAPSTPVLDPVVVPSTGNSGVGSGGQAGVIPVPQAPVIAPAAGETVIVATPVPQAPVIAPAAVKTMIVATPVPQAPVIAPAAGETVIVATPVPQAPVIAPAAGETVIVATPTSEPSVELIPGEFYSFSGRQAVWSDGWGLFKDSPVWGYGFHADRLILGTHMHNSVMHAMLQTGLLGTIPFVLAIVFAWILLLRLVLKLPVLASSDKHLVIQCAGVLAFFAMRSFPESTGAFFGVDWLIIAAMLFYLQMVNFKYLPSKAK